MASTRRGSVTAEEFLTELNNDPDYRARTEKAEAELRVIHEALARAEVPLVEELRAAGIEVESAWDLYQFPEFGERAYPILVKHLLLDYPERVLAGIARAFTRDVARAHWSQLLAIYRTQSQGEAQDGLAATLSGCATRVHYDDLISIIEDESLGETRIYFLRPVNRIGNRLKAGAGHSVIERFADDPILGVEAMSILQAGAATTSSSGTPALSGSNSRTRQTPDYGSPLHQAGAAMCAIGFPSPGAGPKVNATPSRVERVRAEGRSTRSRDARASAGDGSRGAGQRRAESTPPTVGGRWHDASHDGAPARGLE